MVRVEGRCDVIEESICALNDSSAALHLAVVLELTNDAGEVDPELAERRTMVVLGLEDAVIRKSACFNVSFIDPGVDPEMSAKLVLNPPTPSPLVAIIGPRRSSQAVAASFAAFSPPLTPLISPTASSPLLEDVGVLSGTSVFPGLFRAVPNDAKQAAGIAKLIEALNAAKVAVLHLDDAYGVGGMLSIKSLLPEGTDVLHKSHSTAVTWNAVMEEDDEDGEGSDLSPVTKVRQQLLELKENPEVRVVVLFTLSSQIPPILKLIEEADMVEGWVWILSEASAGALPFLLAQDEDDGFIRRRLATEVMEGMLGIWPAAPDSPLRDTFLSSVEARTTTSSKPQCKDLRWENRDGTVTWWMPGLYDASTLVVEAVQRAQNQSATNGSIVGADVHAILANGIEFSPSMWTAAGVSQQMDEVGSVSGAFELINIQNITGVRVGTFSDLEGFSVDFSSIVWPGRVEQPAVGVQFRAALARSSTVSPTYSATIASALRHATTTVPKSQFEYLDEDDERRVTVWSEGGVVFEELTLFARRGAHLIALAGAEPQLPSIAVQMAIRFPEQAFGVLDARVPKANLIDSPPNLFSVGYADDEVDYVAGVACGTIARLQPSPKVAFYVPDTPEKSLHISAFENGLLSACLRCTLLTIPPSTSPQPTSNIAAAYSAPTTPDSISFLTTMANASIPISLPPNFPSPFPINMTSPPPILTTSSKNYSLASRIAVTFALTFSNTTSPTASSLLQDAHISNTITGTTPPSLNDVFPATYLLSLHNLGLEVKWGGEGGEDVQNAVMDVVRKLKNGEEKTGVYWLSGEGFVKARDCNVGEEFDGEGAEAQCTRCSLNTYTLERGAMECKPCIQGAVCAGGADIRADKNHWQSDTSLETLYECPPHVCCVQGSCKRSDPNRCVGNRVGALCSDCPKGTTLVSRFSDCRECSNPSLFLVFIAIILTILSLVFIFIRARDNAANNATIRIIIDGIQLMYLAIDPYRDFSTYLSLPPASLEIDISVWGALLSLTPGGCITSLPPLAIFYTLVFLGALLILGFLFVLSIHQLIAIAIYFRWIHFEANRKKRGGRLGLSCCSLSEIHNHPSSPTSKTTTSSREGHVGEKEGDDISDDTSEGGDQGEEMERGEEENAAHHDGDAEELEHSGEQGGGVGVGGVELECGKSDDGVEQPTSNFPTTTPTTSSQPPPHPHPTPPTMQRQFSSIGALESNAWLELHNWRFVHVLLTVILLTFTSITQTGLELLMCVDVDGEKRVRNFPSVRCSGTLYTIATAINAPLSIFLLVGFPIAVVVINIRTFQTLHLPIPTLTDIFTNPTASREPSSQHQHHHHSLHSSRASSIASSSYVEAEAVPHLPSLQFSHSSPMRSAQHRASPTAAPPQRRSLSGRRRSMTPATFLAHAQNSAELEEDFFVRLGDIPRIVRGASKLWLPFRGHARLYWEGVLYLRRSVAVAIFVCLGHMRSVRQATLFLWYLVLLCLQLTVHPFANKEDNFFAALWACIHASVAALELGLQLVETPTELKAIASVELAFLCLGIIATITAVGRRVARCDAGL